MKAQNGCPSFLFRYIAGKPSQTLIIPAFLATVKENRLPGEGAKGRGAVFRQRRIIPGGGARQKIFCDMNQKAQASLGGLASIFGKFHGKFWRDTPPEAFAVNCAVLSLLKLMAVYIILSNN
ncbi:hypothetical protein [Gemmiger sp. An50]|uniref:hypothetical protein n=1 Tax=Gemmiger sp. An50 TaxID=1965639 RepID=UPI001123D9FB|nr:hypothetical protein [Gemmiger sp. An50]